MKTPNLSGAKNNKGALFLIVIILLALVIGLFIYKNKHQNKNHPEQAQTPIAQIRITSKGFEPATLSAKPGTLIIWTNLDEHPHVVASNPYPKDDGLSGLKSGLLNNGQTYEFRANKSGTFGYHDDLSPTINGSLNIEK